MRRPRGKPRLPAQAQAAAQPERKWWPVAALRQWPQLCEILQLGPPLPPDTSNASEPFCDKLKDVMAEMVLSFGSTHYALAGRLGLSKEFIRQLANKGCNAGQDTVVKICRAAGCSILEVDAEAHARCLCDTGKASGEKRPE